MKILENKINIFLKFMPLVYGCVIEQRRIPKSLYWKILKLIFVMEETQVETLGFGCDN